MSHYVEELNEVSDILEAQVSAGMCRDEVLEALFSTWLEKITSIKDKMKATVITALSSSIKGTPFSTDQKKTLARAVLNIGATKKRQYTGDQIKNATISKTSFLKTNGY